MNKEEQNIEWNPEEAKSRGSLKGDIELKIESLDVSSKIEFSEPKKKVRKRNVSAVVVDISKGNKSKNKSSLF